MNTVHTQRSGMVRLPLPSRCVSALPRPIFIARAVAAPAPCAPDAATQDFVATNQWARDLQGVHDAIHRQIESQLGFLQPQPTVHSADGDLRVHSLSGDVEVRLRTHAGGAVQHKVQSTMPLVKAGIMHTRTIVHACLPQGTPFSDISLIGGSQSAVLAMYMLPRVCAMRHADYRRKYYQTVPALADPTLLPLTKLVHQMRSKSDQMSIMVQAGRDKGTPHVYKQFSSPNMWPRIMSGYGAVFEFQPQAGVIPMVQQDVAAMVRLWCAWVREDWADGNGPALTGTLLEECRDCTRVLANFLEFDEDADKVLQVLGVQGAAKLLDTMSGKAVLAEAPWRAA